MASTDLSDGPVLNLINKRLRALRKKLNRITQLEEAVADGKKPINKEQEDVLRSKPSIIAAIDELDKLRQPLSIALAEEITLALPKHHNDVNIKPTDPPNQNQNENQNPDVIIEDILNLVYFGNMFDVKSQNDYTSTMLMRTHERGCCLTYDYVTDDDSADMLGERDLDLISSVGGLVISRPVDSGLSHKNALQRCIEHAKHWLANSHQPIGNESSVTYAGLREKLTKIMNSDYFTTTPEMKDPVDVAAAAGNYASFQVPIQVQGSDADYQQESEDTANYQGLETYENQCSPEEEFRKGEVEVENSYEVSGHAESVKEQSEEEENQQDVEAKEQQYVPRRPYPNQRGGRGGGGSHRGVYSEGGRGGRFGGRRGGGPYQNGRNHYYEQPGNYYPRNHFNNRGRGGRGGGGGGNSYNNHGSAVQAGNVPADS